MSLHATEPLAAGTRLGDVCELIRPWSQGSAGALWEAQDLKAPRKLTVLLPTAGAAEAEKVLREAQAAAKTAHPSIAQVLHADALPSGAPVLVLEALAGETLAARLERGPLALDAALRVGREVASALAAAHRENVVHGRLTADCVVLCARESAPEQIKVLGFGQSAQPHADVPALANLVRQMLAGRAEEPLTALAGRAPERVIAALGRALEADPAKGFSDVVAFMAECSGRAAQAGDGGFMKFADLEEEATILKPPEKPAATPAVAQPAPQVAPPAASRGWTIAAALLAIAVAIATLGSFALSEKAAPAGAPAPAEAAQPAPRP